MRDKKKYMRSEPYLTPNTLVIDSKPSDYSNYPLDDKEIDFSKDSPLGKIIMVDGSDDRNKSYNVLCFCTSVEVEYL